MSRRPNVLLILTDQLRYPPPYESDELAAYRREHLPGSGAPARERRLVHASLSDGGGVRAEPRVAADRAVPVAARRDADRRAGQERRRRRHVLAGAGHACRRSATGSAPAATGRSSRASGTPRTRTSTPRTAKGYLLSIDDDGTPSEENIKQYLEADLLDEYGFSEWVGPGAARARQAQHRHGQGPLHGGRDDRAAASASTRDESDEPWLTVCSFLNPHDDSLFGVIALTQGLRYHPSTGAARRAGADARRGPVDEAVLPAEHRRHCGARSWRRSRGSRRT